MTHKKTQNEEITINDELSSIPVMDTNTEESRDTKLSENYDKQKDNKKIDINNYDISNCKIRRNSSPEYINKLWFIIDMVNEEMKQKEYMDIDKYTDIEALIKIRFREQYEHSGEVQCEEIWKNAIHDNLIMKKSKRFECKDPKLPKSSTFIRLYEPKKTINKTRHRNDWYCYICHDSKNIPLIDCAKCWRSYHVLCLNMSKFNDRLESPTKFVCINCERLSREIRRYRPSVLDSSRLIKLLHYMMAFLKDKKVFNTLFGGNSMDDEWKRNVLVYSPITFNDIEEKVNKNVYQNIAELENDVHDLTHTFLICNYFHETGPEFLQKFRLFIAEFIQEIEELSICPDCYERSNDAISHDAISHAATSHTATSHGVNPSWFCEPCNPPHRLVYARYPPNQKVQYLPAKVLKIKDNKTQIVKFFHYHTRYIIKRTNVKSIMEMVKSKSMDAAKQNAICELRIHQMRVMQFKGDFNQSPRKSPKKFDLSPHEFYRPRSSPRRRRRPLHKWTTIGSPKKTRSKTKLKRKRHEDEDEGDDGDDGDDNDVDIEDKIMYTQTTKVRRKISFSNDESASNNGDFLLKNAKTNSKGESNDLVETSVRRKSKDKVKAQSSEKSAKLTDKTEPKRRRKRKKKLSVNVETCVENNSSVNDNNYLPQNYRIKNNKKNKNKSLKSNASASTIEINDLPLKMNDLRIENPIVNAKVNVKPIETVSANASVEPNVGQCYMSLAEHLGNYPEIKRYFMALENHHANALAQSNQMNQQLSQQLQELKRQKTEEIQQLSKKLDESRKQSDEYIKKDAMINAKLDNQRKQYLTELDIIKRTRWCIVCLKVSTMYCCWATYCSRECQNIHWRKDHALNCDQRKRMMQQKEEATDTGQNGTVINGIVTQNGSESTQ